MNVGFCMCTGKGFKGCGSPYVYCEACNYFQAALVGQWSHYDRMSVTVMLSPIC